MKCQNSSHPLDGLIQLTTLNTPVPAAVKIAFFVI